MTVGVHRVSWFVYKYDGDEDKSGAASQRVLENTEANKLGLVVADDIDDDWDASSHTPIHNTPGTASTSNTNNELNTVPQLSTPTPSRSRSRSRSFFQRIPNPRRMSFDASQFRRMSLDEPDEAPSRHLNTHQLPPIPPYSPFTPPAMTSDFSHYLTAHGVNTNLIHSISNDRPPASPVPSLENSRHSPYSSFRGSYILFLFSLHRC